MTQLASASGCLPGLGAPVDTLLPDALRGMLRPVNVVVGHYGAGKTNLALNIALDVAHAGKRVVLVDLDVVNPYFRSTEYRALLEGSGVEVVAPVFAEAGSSLDVPSLTGAVVPAIERAQAGECICLIDAGGDEVGATALRRFAQPIADGSHAMLAVVNCYRNLTQTPQEACEVLDEIERASGLRVTGLVSNAHLMDDTAPETIVHGVEVARGVSRRCDLPLLCATVPKTLVQLERERLNALCGKVGLYPVDQLVKTPWQV